MKHTHKWSFTSTNVLVNHCCIEAGAQVCGVDSESESWNLQRAHIIWAAVPTSRALGPQPDIWPCFRNGRHRGGGSPSNHESQFQNHAEKTGFRRLTWAHGSKEKPPSLNGWTLQPFPPIHAPKGPDFLLSGILARTYEIVQIDREEGSCVWPKKGNHARKLDKIKEWQIELSQRIFPLAARFTRQNIFWGHLLEFHKRPSLKGFSNKLSCYQKPSSTWGLL